MEDGSRTVKKRILFVDDEAQILAGLRNRLRKHRKKWEMFFVESGLEALEILAARSIDVVVSARRIEFVRTTLPARTFSVFE